MVREPYPARLLYGCLRQAHCKFWFGPEMERVKAMSTAKHAVEQKFELYVSWDTLTFV